MSPRLRCTVFVVITAAQPRCNSIISRCAMPRAHVVYCFGAFELDPATRQVTSGAGSVHLTDPQWALLQLLVTSAPDVVDKDALANAGWGGAAVSPNSIEQAI